MQVVSLTETIAKASTVSVSPPYLPDGAALSWTKLFHSVPGWDAMHDAENLVSGPLWCWQQEFSMVQTI
jgi:hypothetical protein